MLMASNLLIDEDYIAWLAQRDKSPDKVDYIKSYTGKPGTCVSLGFFACYYRDLQNTDKRRVMVEERYYERPERKNFLTQKSWEEKHIEIYDDMKQLTKLFQMQPKPKNLRVLNCLGVYHDLSSHEFGFVHEFPEEEQDLEPVTLLEIIHDARNREQPSIQIKLNLFQAIASCIHSFHSTGWLHTKLSSDRLCYFKKPGQDLSTLDLSKPYLTKFQYSKRMKPGAYTEEWGTVGEELHPAFEYYALGKILLQIATWRLRGEMVDVPQRMGADFCNVIKACLNFRSSHIDDKNKSSLLKRFQNEVLDELDRLQGTLLTRRLEAQTSILSHYH